MKHLFAKKTIIWEVIFIQNGKTIGSVNVAQSIPDNSDSLCYISIEDIQIRLIVYNYKETQNEQLIER